MGVSPVKWSAHAARLGGGGHRGETVSAPTARTASLPVLVRIRRQLEFIADCFFCYDIGYDYEYSCTVESSDKERPVLFVPPLPPSIASRSRTSLSPCLPPSRASGPPSPSTPRLPTGHRAASLSRLIPAVYSSSEKRIEWPREVRALVRRSSSPSSRKPCSSGHERSSGSRTRSCK